MTALSTASTAFEGRERGFARRVTDVVRLQFANRWAIVGLPWIVLGSVFALTLVGWLIANAAVGHNVSGTDSRYSGGTAALLVYMLITALQAVNLTLPYALSCSVTRRDYFVGTWAAFILQSLMFTAGYVLLSYIEQWTDGWGAQVHLFHVVYLGGGPLLPRAFTIFALFLLSFSMGIAFGSAFFRWKVNGALVLGGGLAVVLVIAIGAVVVTHQLGAVAAWIASAWPTGIFALTLPISAAAVLGSYLMLRIRR